MTFPFKTYWGYQLQVFDAHFTRKNIKLYCIYRFSTHGIRLFSQFQPRWVFRFFPANVSAKNKFSGRIYTLKQLLTILAFTFLFRWFLICWKRFCFEQKKTWTDKEGFLLLIVLRYNINRYRFSYTFGVAMPLKCRCSDILRHFDQIDCADASNAKQGILI